MKIKKYILSAILLMGFLTVYSQIDTCPEIIDFDYSLVYDCNSITVTLNSVNLSEEVDITNYYFVAEDKSTYDAILYHPFQIKPATYFLEIRNTKKCKIVSSTFDIFNHATCDDIFTPDGDGNQDFYYIPGVGQAVILDRFGRQVQKVDLPFYWYGTDDNDNTLPVGMYVIMVDTGNSWQVTIVR